jgi:hypothetical protein
VCTSVLFLDSHIVLSKQAFRGLLAEYMYFSLCWLLRSLPVDGDYGNKRLAFNPTKEFAVNPHKQLWPYIIIMEQCLSNIFDPKISWRVSHWWQKEKPGAEGNTMESMGSHQPRGMESFWSRQFHQILVWGPNMGFCSYCTTMLFDL